MSLWYESFLSCLSGCEDNEEQAKCILRFLAMPVPRMWWEKALESGSVDDTHASVLCNGRKDLTDALENKVTFDFGLLVALAFIDVDYPGAGMGAGRTDATIDDYLEKAKGVLEKRPELAELGRQIADFGKGDSD